MAKHFAKPILLISPLPLPNQQTPESRLGGNLVRKGTPSTRPPLSCKPPTIWVRVTRCLDPAMFVQERVVARGVWNVEDHINLGEGRTVVRLARRLAAAVEWYGSLVFNLEDNTYIAGSFIKGVHSVCGQPFGAAVRRDNISYEDSLGPTMGGKRAATSG